VCFRVSEGETAFAVPRILGANFLARSEEKDRGREDRVVPIPSPSEPDRRISRIRLSGR